MDLKYLNLPPEPDAPGAPEPFDLSVPFERGFNKASLRCLVIIETVPSSDLRTGALLSPGRSRDLVMAVLDRAVKQAAAYAKRPTPAMVRQGHRSPDEVRSWSFGFLNFNDRRWFSLDGQERQNVVSMAAARALKYIRRIHPDLVLVAGAGAAAALTDFSAYPARHFGRMTWVSGTDIPAVATLDITSTEPPRDDGDAANSPSAVAKPNILGHACRNIVTGLLGCHPHSISDLAVKPVLVDDMDAAEALIRRAARTKAVAIDVETTSLETSEAELLTVQLGLGPDEGHIIPIHHPDTPWSPSEIKRIRSLMMRWLGRPRTDAKRYIIGQNVGYDMRILIRWLSLRHWGLPVWDLMAGEHLLDENIKLLRRFGADSIHGLPQIAAYYDSDHFWTAEFSKDDRTALSEADISRGSPALEYMAADVQIPFAIHVEQARRAAFIPHRGGSYRRDYARAMLTVMSSMVRVSMLMRYRGTHVDQRYIMEIMAGSEELSRMAKAKMAEFRALPDVRKAEEIVRRGMGVPDAGFFGKSRDSGSSALDIGKPEHKRALFIDVAGLKPIKVGKSGMPSFDKGFLAAHKDVDCVRVFSEYSELRQLQSSFIEPFGKLMAQRADNRHDSRIHPDFGYATTWTGRSNSSGPSLQQVPEHKATAKLVKRMLVTKAGHLHYEIDYSQFEVRCLALLSGDSAMKEMMLAIHDVVMAFRMDPTEANRERKAVEGDFHKSNYAFFTGTPIGEVGKSQRQANKGIIFGIMYGMADESLGRATGRSTEEAAKLRAAFYARFPEARAYLEGQVEKGKDMLYTSSPLGRRRNLFAYLSSMRAIRGGTDRRAQNSEIQGMASDLCWMAADLFSRNMAECMSLLSPKSSRRPFTSGGPDEPVDAYLPCGPNAIVHDSCKGEAPFGRLLAHIHLLEHSMTAGLVDRVEREFGWRIDVPLDVEVDIGAGWSDKRGWDGSADGLDSILLSALEAHRGIHGTSAVPDPSRELRRMKASYARQRDRLGMDERWPLPHPLPV